MALIQVTPDLLNSKANELRGLKAQHDEAMSKMRTEAIAYITERHVPKIHIDYLCIQNLFGNLGRQQQTRKRKRRRHWLQSTLTFMRSR